MLYEYVVVKSDCLEDVNEIDCWIFQELSSAKDKLDELAKQAEKEMSISTQDVSVDTSDMSYEIYQNGRYCENHITIMIKRTEVE